MHYYSHRVVLPNGELYYSKFYRLKIGRFFQKRVVRLFGGLFTHLRTTYFVIPTFEISKCGCTLL